MKLVDGHLPAHAGLEWLTEQLRNQIVAGHFSCSFHGTRTFKEKKKNPGYMSTNFWPMSAGLAFCNPLLKMWAYNNTSFITPFMYCIYKVILMLMLPNLLLKYSVFVYYSVKHAAAASTPSD